MPYKDIKKRKEYMKTYYQKHRNLLLNQKKNYYQDKRLEILTKQKIYTLKHKYEVKEYMKQYQQIHKKEQKDYNKIYAKNHKNQIRNQRRIYENNRLKLDIDFKIRKNLRTRIWLTLKGFNKSVSTLKLLGCSLKCLKNHLESRFINGMSWSNYGKWHIDHIRPCASFDLTKVSEQRKCFNYKNLQPLWAKENRIKKDNF